MTPLDANAEKAAAIADFATAAAVSPVTVPLNALPAVGSTTLTAEDILTQAQEKAEKEMCFHHCDVEPDEILPLI